MRAEHCPTPIDSDRVGTPRSFLTSRLVGEARRHELVFQRVRCSQASGGVGADLVRWAIWSASALLLATVSFGAGSGRFRRSSPRCQATNPSSAANLMTVCASASRSGRARTSCSLSSPMKVFFPTGGVATIRMRVSSFRAESYARKSFVCSGAPTWLGPLRASAAHMKAGAYDRVLTKSRTSPA